MEKPNDNKIEWLKIAFKIICEIIFLLAVSFYLILIAEVVLPGFISSQLSLGYVLTILLILLTVALMIGKKLDLRFFPNKTGLKKYFRGFSFFLAIIIFLSLLKFGFALAIILTFAALAVVYYLFRVTITEE